MTPEGAMRHFTRLVVQVAKELGNGLARWGLQPVVDRVCGDANEDPAN